MKTIMGLILIIFLSNIVIAQDKILDEDVDDALRKLDEKLTIRFLDAVNGKAITNAKINIEHLFSDTTDYEGKIVFDIPADDTYLINFVHPKYINSIIMVRIIAGTLIFNRFSISPLLPIGSLRVVLDWGNNPKDLDAHFVKKGDYHISFRNMKNNKDNTAMLDRDDLDGLGPETITVSNINTNSEYFYYVHNYSNKDAGESKDLSNSKARILVFGDNRLIEQIEISKSINGKFWNVFKIINGKIVVLNNLTNSTIN